MWGKKVAGNKKKRTIPFMAFCYRRAVMSAILFIVSILFGLGTGYLWKMLTPTQKAAGVFLIVIFLMPAFCEICWNQEIAPQFFVSSEPLE
jgi:hypothetical protein